MESTWYNISEKGGLPDNAPRRLTLDQIEELLNALPSVRCGDKEAREEANTSIKRFLKAELTSVYLAPSEFSDFKDKLVNNFTRARVVQSDSVGISTADALGESSTQVALNTFHVGGAATAALVGIEGLKTLIFAYQPKNRSTVIHLNVRPKDFDETLAIRKELEGLSIGDLINMKDFEIDTFKELKRPSWYDYYELIYNFPTNPDTMVLRLPLKLDKLLYFGITMEMLYDTIDKLSYGNYQSPIVRIIYSPLPEATIDLHLIPGRISSGNPGLQKFVEISFFRDTVIPLLETVYIKGVPCIKKVYPVSSAVWEKSFSIVRSLYPDEEKEGLSKFPGKTDGKKIWYVELNLSLMNKSGITMEELTGLLGSLGLEWVIEENIMYVYNPFHKGDDLSTFIRERKTGLPYIKDQDILVTKKNKYINNANIRIYPHEDNYWIKYDPKYVKHVLFYMKEMGFVWSFSDSILLWRVIKYDSDAGKSVEILSINKPEPDKADQVKAFRLINPPDWLYPDLDSDLLTDYISFYEIYDFDRVFFLSKNFEPYIYFDPKYEDELRFHMNKIGITWDDLIEFRVKSETDIFLRERKDPNIIDTSYMNHRPIYKKDILKLVEEKGYQWGDPIPFDVITETQTNYSKANGKGNIELYPLKLPQKLMDKIIKKMKKSDEFDEKVYQDFVNKRYGQIPVDDIDNIDTLIMSTISSEIRKVSSAKFYDHWFITTRDKTDKKFSIYDTLSHPLIDSTRTFNNNLSEIASILGVEAAYSYFIKALKDLNSASGNYIDPRHILMIADFIFSRGKPNTVQFTGLSRQPIGHISLITVERAMEVLRKLAFTGNTENINSVSAAISTGQNTPLGTGMIRFSDNPKAQKQILRFNRNIDSINMGPDEMSEEIKKLSKDTSNNFEPNKIPGISPAGYKLGKVYKLFEDLFKDVMEDTKSPEYLGLSNEYSNDILPLPAIVIHPMVSTDQINAIFSGAIPEFIKKVPKKKTVVAVTLNPDNVKRGRLRGRPAPPVEPGNLPKLDPDKIFQHMERRTSSYIDTDAFEKFS